MKIKLEYDLPEFDPEKHDPDKVFGFLTYRGVRYECKQGQESETHGTFCYRGHTYNK